MPFSDASPNELTSPYYVQNKKICESFEQFILSKNGNVKGKYNAWSYVVYGKIPHHNKWEFKIKKATYSSGNLLLSTKYQSLQFESIWYAHSFKSDCSHFKIVKSKWTDIFTKSKQLDHFKGYVIQTKHNENHQLIQSLLKILHPLFNTNEIWEISYQNNKLTIETRSEQLHLKIINQLLDVTNEVD